MPQVQGQFTPGMAQRAQLMNGVQDDMDKKTLMHTAIANNNGRKVQRPGQPMPMQQNVSQPMPMMTMQKQHQLQQQQQQLQLQQQQQLLQQQQQQQQQQVAYMRRLELTDQENDPNSSSPALGQGNSPNKRARLSPPNDNFPAQNQIPTQGQPPNGMQHTNQNFNHNPLSQMTNAAAAHAFLKQQQIPIPVNATGEQVLTMARSILANGTTNAPKVQQLQSYKQNLALQQSQQGLGNRGSLGGASPANQQAQIPFGNPNMGGRPTFTTDNGEKRAPTADELAALQQQAASMGGTLKHPPSGGNHSLQDYQSQLMVLEQQNKKRLQHARNETSSRGDEPGGGPLNGQFPPQGGQGLHPGHPQLQGTSMSPSNSRTGPSPQISSQELAQVQRKGQKGGSGGASPDPEGVQMRGPSPASFSQQGQLSQEQIQQIQQMAAGQQAGYPHPMMLQNGQQFGRPMPGMQFNPTQNQIATEMMLKQRMAQQQQPGQPGQPFQQGWPPQMMNQAMTPVPPSPKSFT